VEPHIPPTTRLPETIKYFSVLEFDVCHVERKVPEPYDTHVWPNSSGQGVHMHAKVTRLLVGY